MSRKDQVDTKEDIKMLKDELWKRRLVIKAEIVIFRGNQIVKETTLLEKIQKNNMPELKIIDFVFIFIFFSFLFYFPFILNLGSKKLV